MNKSSFSFSLIMAFVALSLEGCIIGQVCQTNYDCPEGLECGAGGICEEPIETGCKTSKDCDYPREVCHYSGLCAMNPDYNPGEKVTLGMHCNMDTDCKLGVEECKNEVCVEKVEKECYGNQDCVNKYGKGYICEKNICVDDGIVEQIPQVSFKVTYGSNLGSFSHSQSWRNILGAYDGHSSIIVNLCDPEDVGCVTPKRIIEIGEAHGYSSEDIIQGSFGPTIHLYGIDPGTYNLMVFADSERSIKLNAAYSDVDYPGEICGGFVSETDMVMSSQKPSEKVNPIPESLSITVEKDKTLDLGTLTLSHFYERDISPHPESEAGRILAVVGSGFRAIDLDSYELIPIAEGTKYVDHVPVDDKGEPISDTACGIIKTHDELVWLLYQSSDTSNAGYAVPFNPKTLKQIGTSRVVFPNIDNSSPCKGISHINNDKIYLFVANYPGPANAKPGLWSAEVSGVVGADAYSVTANAYSQTVDPLYRAGSYALAAYGNTLYTMPVPSQDNTGSLQPCDATSVCAFKIKINPNGQLEVLKESDNQYAILNAGNYMASLTTEEGAKLNCNPNRLSTPSMGIGVYEDKAFLFLSRCLDMAVYDLKQNEAKVDMNAVLPGTDNMPIHLFGQFMHAFSPSPDGKILWAIPSNTSLVHLFAELENRRVTYNRFAAMPIDITGSVPRIAEEYTKLNVDNYVGATESENKSPEFDPGLDLTNFFLQQYIIRWYPALQGSTPFFGVTGPKVAVAQNTLWISNSSNDEAGANMGQYQDIAVFDLKEQRTVMIPRKEYETFYRVFSNGITNPMGFPLDPTGASSIDSNGIVYIKL